MEGLVRCRCCGVSFPAEPVLSYRNMPARAQDFPQQQDLDRDNGIDLDILQCPYCGLIQIGGEPVAYYRDVLRAVGLSEEMKTFRRAQFREFLIQNRLIGKRVIEVGAGCGEYMELMEEAGARVWGLEHRRESVETAQAKGLHMHTGFLETEKTPLPGGPYDGFFCMSYLEHIPEPGNFLRAIANGLSPGGVGLVEVPNGDFILDNHIFSEFMLDHLSYFTEETFRLILGRNGFEVLSCGVVWQDYILSAVVRKRESGGKWTQFRQAQEKLVGEIQRYTSDAGRLAVWGAGHQSLALLALAGVERQVAYVVDSAPFKQNRFTPATHIPVVAPAMLTCQPVDALLVMAGSYSQEIISIVRRSWPQVRLAIAGETGVMEVEANG